MKPCSACCQEKFLLARRFCSTIFHCKSKYYTVRLYSDFWGSFTTSTIIQYDSPVTFGVRLLVQYRRCSK